MSNTSLTDLPTDVQEELDDVPVSTRLVLQVLLASDEDLTKTELVESTRLAERTVDRSVRELQSADLINGRPDPRHPQRKVYSPEPSLEGVSD